MTKDALEERCAHTAAVAYIGELSALQELKGALEALDNAVEESGFETREGSEA